LYQEDHRDDIDQRIFCANNCRDDFDWSFLATADCRHWKNVRTSISRACSMPATPNWQVKTVAMQKLPAPKSTRSTAKSTTALTPWSLSIWLLPKWKDLSAS
jgi:hypothetical protein